MYDEKHRFFTVSSSPETKDRTHQKGVREKLLCLKCESQFSRYEKYFSELFSGRVMADYTADEKNLYIRRIDYRKVKLLFLSILWRMSVCSVPFFDAVDLGPHEEKVRKMLLSEDPGSVEAYGVMAVVPYFEGKFLGDLITSPDIARVPGNRIYRVVLGGVLYLFYVPGKNLPPEILAFLPSPTDTWRFRKEKLEDIKFLFHYTMRVGAGINERGG